MEKRRLSRNSSQEELIKSIPSQVSFFLIAKVQTVTEKPNHITPSVPYRVTETDNLLDDRVERAFRLDAMRRKIVTAGL